MFLFIQKNQKEKRYLLRKAFLYNLNKIPISFANLSNSMDFSQIQEIIRLVSKHKLTEFVLKEGDFRLELRNHSNIPGGQHSAPVVVQAPAPAPAPPPAAVAPAATPAPAAPKADVPAAPAVDDDSKYLSIKSPMVGTFYRSSSPDKPAFVKVGDSIDTGQTVCIIEAMKLFNEIESDVKGKIVKVLVEDASPVEYEQVLFLVDPS